MTKEEKKSEYNKAYHKKIYQNPEYRERAKIRAKEWAKNNPEKRAQIDKRRDQKRRLLEPEKLLAKQLVAQRVYRGTMQPASALDCSVCGKPAKHYHHYMGYAREHRFTVMPVCILCHVKEHRT